jgi:hypothetical protein
MGCVPVKQRGATMSISTLQSSINRIQRDIADLQKKISNEKKKEADAFSRANRAQRGITKSSSAATIRSKMSEIERCNRDVENASKRQYDYQKKIADKSKDLSRYQQQLAKEQEKSLKAHFAVHANITADIRSELQEYRALIRSTPEMPKFGDGESYDLFISHAFEDKDSFVRPLAEELERIGVKVWLDEKVFKIGDSISQSIDKGILNSKFGLTVLSKQFFSKYWTNYEYRGLLTRDSQGFKTILPIWFGVNREDVIQFSPTLADRYAFQFPGQSIEDIAADLKTLVDGA